MIKIAIKNLRNEQVGEVELREDIFNYPYKEHLIYEAVKHYRSERRSGTAKTKNRSEVAGSGRKLWKQKGTGRARVGDARSPLRRHGGTVFGPVPRGYDSKMNVKSLKNALKSALSRKVKQDELVLVDSLAVQSHKTKELAAAIAALGISKKALLVDSRENGNLQLAARNHPRLKSVDARAVHVYDVVNSSYLILSREALDTLVEVLA